MRVVVRLLVIASAMGWAGALFGRAAGRDASSASYAGAAVLIGLALYLSVRLVHTVERPARDLTRFLEGIRYDDFSQRFAQGKGLLGTLGSAFEAVNDAFRQVRAEREEQSQYLQAVVRHVGVSLVAFRDDGTITLFNPSARRTLGVPRPRSLDSLASRAPDVAKALRDVQVGDRVLIRLDREDQTLELVAYATRFNAGNVTHTLVSLQDIREELEERELDAWQQLTRVLTHEITNSVAPISSLAGTALTRLGPSEDPSLSGVRESLETIERRSRHLVSFVESYRSLARLPKPSPEVILASELLGDVVTLFRTTAAERGVTVEVHVDPERFELVADPELIEQALVNLVLNAIQAVGEHGGGNVHVRASPGADGRAVLEVADDGPGLLPEVRDRVFVPFFSTKSGGSGIGLSLAHRIARLHGGSLTVASEPGVETVFTLRL
ncbi:MAG: sensor histidine kinase [Rubricoccaceae bacterium]